jgi:hypothetical protein
MIDNFVLSLTHGLMLLIAWRLISRPDLQDEVSPSFLRSDRHDQGRPKPSHREGKDLA